MKLHKLISMVLTAAILAVSLCISVPAAGTLVFSDDFDAGFIPRNWITSHDFCHYEWDKYNKCIHGYDSARVLQTNFGGNDPKAWDKFYSSMDVQIRAFDDLPSQEGRPHYVKMWYRDLFEDESGEYGPEYYYSIEIETGKATLEKQYSDTSENNQNINAVIAEGQIPGTIEVAEDAEWFNIGMRVTDGKIECYYNERLVMSSSADDAGDEYVNGVSTNAVDPTVGSQKSPILFWNIGNWIAFDNFEVWSADYDFSLPATMDGKSYGYLKLVDAADGYLYYDLIFHDAAELGVSSMGFELDYSEKMTLVSCEQVFNKGTFVTSEYEDVKPYMVLWVWGTKVLPNEEVVIARLTFRVDCAVKDDDELWIDLWYEEDNRPAGLHGILDQSDIDIVPEEDHVYSDIIAAYPEADARPVVSFLPYGQTGNELELMLTLDIGYELDIESVEFTVDWADFMTPADFEDTYSAEYTHGDGDKPYHTHIKYNYNIGTGIHSLISARFVLDPDAVDFDSPAVTVDVKAVKDREGNDITEYFIERDYTLDPATLIKCMSVQDQPEKVKCSLNDSTVEIKDGTVAMEYWNGEQSEPISLTECTVTDYEEVMFEIMDDDGMAVDSGTEHRITVYYNGFYTTVIVDSVYSPGDLNGDYAVNLSDVTLLLKAIAKWDVTYNPYGADANEDGAVNLSDATIMLQFIAKWDVKLG